MAEIHLLSLDDSDREQFIKDNQEAFNYGAPPHCGVGIGLERLVMILSGTDNIKDVVAFPKTASAYCLMSDAPNTVDQDQLDFLALAIRED